MSDKGCEYCEKGHNLSEGGISLRVCSYEGLLIEVNDYSGFPRPLFETEIGINFCPMCGTELGDSNE